jgi:hypothetical protein
MIVLISCNAKTDNKENLENSIWKRCGGAGGASLPDILGFSTDVLYIKNDSIFYNGENSFIGKIYTIEYYYCYRRLLVKDLNGNIGRYCEQ